MHDIEPFYGWEKYYSATLDSLSPFYGREYNGEMYENAIYGYFIHPLWDELESETLYAKVLFVDYQQGVTVIELFGEWNDTLHNDIMLLKRNLIDYQLAEGISKFILIGENVLQFHGMAEDDYYAEWLEEVEEGWIVALNFRDFIQREWQRFGVQAYFNYGSELDTVFWRTMTPQQLIQFVTTIIERRLTPGASNYLLH